MIQDVDAVELQVFLNKSDVELVIDNIESLSHSLYGLTFLNQIYATLNNNTLVDLQMKGLKQQPAIYKLLNYDFGTRKTCEIVIMKTGRYIETLTTAIRKQGNLACCAQIVNKVSKLVSTTTVMSFKRSELSGIDNTTSIGTTVLLTDAEVDWLLAQGFLRHRLDVQLHATSSASSQNEVYWLSHPKLGALSKYMQNAEKVIVLWIKKTKHKEISEKVLLSADKVNIRKSELKNEDVQNNCNEATKDGGGGFISEISILGKRKASTAASNTLHQRWIKYSLDECSPLPIEYHLLDLIGRHVVYKVPSPASDDYIIRLNSNVNS